MSKKQYDYLVFIGRFQPFHYGHEEVIDKALSLADKVILLVGSSNQPRTIKNPFTFEERKMMIKGSYDQKDPSLTERILIEPLRDQKYNDQACCNNKIFKFFTFYFKYKVHIKASSYYFNRILFIKVKKISKKFYINKFVLSNILDKFFSFLKIFVQNFT